MPSTPGSLTRWRGLFAALAAALTSALAAPALATKPMPSPPPSSFDHPAVQFVEPKTGAKLSNVAPVELALGAVPQIAKLEFGLAGQLSQVPLGANLFLRTRDMPNGRHAVVARATYRSGRVIEATIRVDIYNPRHRLKLIDPVTRAPHKGGPVILDLTYSEPVRIEADFSDLDSAFDPTKVTVTALGADVYRVSYPLSAGSTRPEGRHQVTFKARNERAEVIDDFFEIELRQNPRVPLVVNHCAYAPKTMGAMLVDRVGEEPQVEIAPGARVARDLEIKALPDLVVGRANHARVLWKAAPAHNAARREEPRLVIKARGYSGYYLCWIPEGVTTGHLELSMPPKGSYGSNLAEGDPAPSQIDMMVALETNGVATAWVSHRFTVRPAGWQRVPTRNEEITRQRKIKIRKAAQRK